MATNNRTCLQILVTRGKSDDVVVDYLTLLGSRRATYSLKSGPVHLDLANFAQVAGPGSDQLLTINIEHALTGIVAAVGERTGIFATSAKVRELEIDSQTTPTIGLGGIPVHVRRNGSWKGPSGPVDVVFTRPETQAVELTESFTLKQDVRSFTVDASGLAPGAYTMSVSSKAFNAPSIVRSVHVKEISPSTIFLAIGLLLLLASVGRGLYVSGFGGRVALICLVAVTCTLLAFSSITLLNGRAVVTKPPTQKIDTDPSGASKAAHPPGSTEALLDNEMKTWRLRGETFPHLFTLPVPSETARNSPLVFRRLEDPAANG